jgi:hypothetical protein
VVRTRIKVTKNNQTVIHDEADFYLGRDAQTSNGIAMPESGCGFSRIQCP